MSTWTAELINLLFHLTPKRHRYDIRSSYQWHRVPWYAGRNSANPRWRARKPRLVHAGFVAEPKDNQPPFLLWRQCFSKEKHYLWLLNNLPKEFGRLFSSYYTKGCFDTDVSTNVLPFDHAWCFATGVATSVATLDLFVSTLACRPMVPLDSF